MCEGMRYLHSRLHYIKNCPRKIPPEEKVCGAAVASPLSCPNQTGDRSTAQTGLWVQPIDSRRLRLWVGDLALLPLGVCHSGLPVQSVQPQPLLHTTIPGFLHILQFSLKVSFTPRCSLSFQFFCSISLYQQI